MLRVLFPVLLLAACGGPDSRPTLRVETVERPCLAKPPPQPTPIAANAPSEELVCLARDDMAAMVRYLAEVQRWANDAWILCGPAPAESKHR